jgi:hypothetical protein
LYVVIEHFRGGDPIAVYRRLRDKGRSLPETALHRQAICDGVALLTWRADTFAYAESLDEPGGRYRGLRGGQGLRVTPEDSGVLVKVGVAVAQLDAEAAATGPGTTAGATGTSAGGPGGRAAGAATGTDTATERPTTPPRRFHGTVGLDSTRVGRDASRIADEVIAHLAGLVGAEVTVTLEIEASLPSGASEQTVRTVTENARTLRFKSHGFEKE